MESEEHSRNMAQEKHSHYAAKHQGKIGFSSPRFASSFVGTPVVSLHEHNGSNQPLLEC